MTDSEKPSKPLEAAVRAGVAEFKDLLPSVYEQQDGEQIYAVIAAAVETGLLAFLDEALGQMYLEPEDDWRGCMAMLRRVAGGGE